MFAISAIRRISSAWLCSVVALTMFWPEVADAEDKAIRLRILTYNIHHGEGSDRRFDLERLAAVIKSADPDLVALQEVDQATERSGAIDQAARLSELTGLKGVFGKAMDYRGGAYGLAILARWPLSDAMTHSLGIETGIEPRIAFSARVKVGVDGPAISFIVTHLDHRSDPTHRSKQVAALREILPGTATDQPMILAGDFNATAESAVMQSLFAEWTDTAAGREFFTIPASTPRRKIDYILCRPAARWRTLETRALDEAIASDHRPVLAVVELLP